MTKLLLTKFTMLAAIFPDPFLKVVFRCNSKVLNGEKIDALSTKVVALFDETNVKCLKMF